MGYTTYFKGEFRLDRSLDDDLYEFLVKFSETRRMKRKVDAKYGIEGEFYVDGGGMAGQDREDNIVDYNEPPRTQPGLWCQWVPTDDKMGITWDGGEKFYDYVEWLEYIVTNFLAPNGYKLNGQVMWQGEEVGDVGLIDVEDNVIEANAGIIQIRLG